MTEEKIVIVPKNIEFPYARKEMISFLRHYSNIEYQQYVLTKGGATYYGCGLFTSFFSIEDQYMIPEFNFGVDNPKPPYDLIGSFYRTKREVELMFNFCILFEQLMDEGNQNRYDQHYDKYGLEYIPSNNEVYFALPIFGKMVEAAKVALDEFIKNEADDAEYSAEIQKDIKMLDKLVDDRKAELAGKPPY
jgi:hypothetical protein